MKVSQKPVVKPFPQRAGVACRTHLRGGVYACFTRKTGSGVYKICNPGEGDDYSVTKIS